MPIPKLVITAALAVAQVALGAMQKFEGPRLDDLDISLADYGTPLPRFWGVSRFDGCPIIWAEKLREKKTTNKTKGGKYAEYKYYGTWAVAIADNQIDAVSRIWMDKHLCFQLKDAGPITAVGALMQTFDFGSGGGDQPVKLAQNINMRIYTGTEDQEPDPRIEAWCEDRYGPDSCPAYKGVAYIVFRDIPLEKFGNRIPQVNVEAVSSSDGNFLVESFPATNALSGFAFSSDFSRFLISNGTHFELWDTATRTITSSGDFLLGMGADPLGLSNGGTIWGISSWVSASQLRGASYDGFGTVTPDIPIGALASGVICVDEAVYMLPTGNLNSQIIYLSGAEVIVESAPFSPLDYIADPDGNHWAVGRAGTSIGLQCVSGPRYGDGGTFTSPTGSNSSVLAVHNGTEFVVAQDNRLYKVDPNTFTVTASATVSTSTNLIDSTVAWRNLLPGATSVWYGLTEVSLETLTVIRTLSLSNWGLTGSLVAAVYDPINHALIARTNVGGTTTIYWLYLDRIANPGVTLATVVSDVAAWCGVTDYDASDLDQTVKGYLVVQGTGRDMIEPLLTAHDSDARPHDFGIEFIKRGSGPALTIETADFAKISDSRYTWPRGQDTDLPQKITVNFADEGKDHQVNNVIAQRPLDASDASGEQTLDLKTYVGSPSEIKPIADRYFRRRWNERETINNALTAQHLGIEPGDVVTLSLDGVERSVRATRVTLTQGALACEWVRDHPRLALLGSGTGAEMEGRDPETVYVSGPAKAIVLDAPMFSDDHDNVVPQVYYGAGKYLASAAFAGADIYRADEDGNEYGIWNGVDSSDAMTWGYATDALGDANPNCWDRGNSVNVDVKGGTLSSVTEDAINADPTLNLANLGGEWLNFATATLEADGTYTLSTLKRGRRGTEWAVDQHEAGDEFVLASDLFREGIGLSEVGTPESFKALALGRNLDTSPAISFTYSGNTLKPYAPARLKWVYNGTDLVGTITRRTRVGGSWSDDGVVPVSEASEAYEVDIYNGATFKRTIEVSGTNVFTYTAAMASADGITLPTAPTSYVYQMSDAVGRGFALAA